MLTGEKLEATPFFFFSPACLVLVLRVVVFSLGIVNVLRDQLASLTRQVRVMMVNEGSGWMMRMKSRSDVIRITWQMRTMRCFIAWVGDAHICLRVDR